MTFLICQTLVAVNLHQSMNDVCLKAITPQSATQLLWIHDFYIYYIEFRLLILSLVLKKLFAILDTCLFVFFLFFLKLDNLF